MVRGGPGADKKIERAPLDWKPASRGAHQLALFAEKFLRIPKGKGIGTPFRVRPWQRSMVATLLDDPKVQLALWFLPRGNGKSGISSVVALHHAFYSGLDQPRVLLVAQDERAAKRLLATVAKTVEKSPELDKRCLVYADRVEVPCTGATILALPGTMEQIEGEDATLAIVDEFGFVASEVFESVVFSMGKRPGTKVLGIGTPPTSKWRDKSSAWKLRKLALGDPNGSIRLVEYAAPADADIDSPETWKIANPAFGDWLDEDTLRHQRLVSREHEFRRARLGQAPDSSEESAVSAPGWRRQARAGVWVPRGSKVVVALDGSHNGDSTVLVVGSVSAKPHFHLGAPDIPGIWSPAETGEEVDVLAVEDAVRELAKYYQVVEIVADPYRWTRTLQLLAGEGLPVAKFPQTPSRLTPATNDLRAAVANGGLTHNADERFSRQVLAARLDETIRGTKFAKPSKNERIDAAVGLAMAYSRAYWLGHLRKKTKTRGYQTRTRPRR